MGFDEMKDEAWPPVAFEERQWQIKGTEYASRRQLQRARGPYQAAVPSFIAAQNINVSAEVHTLASEASQALTRFDAESGEIIAPFQAALLRSESVSSSEVEQLTASARQIALAGIGRSKSENAKLIHSNVLAMQTALESAEHIDVEAIVAMQKALLGDFEPDLVGSFRQQQVWIGGGGISPHGAEFVPPHHNKVPALMDDLIMFIQRLDIPVLVHAAIAHAQFETIHPFPDGNGRTGRALIHAMFKSAELVKNVTIPVSAGLLAQLDRYFSALGDFRNGNIEPIIEVFADAAFWAVENGKELVHDLSSLQKRWLVEVKGRQGSAVLKTLDLLLMQPVVDVHAVKMFSGVSEVAAQSAIDRLVDAGVLSLVSAGRRNRLWQASEVLDVLDSFASKVRRSPMRRT